MRIVGIDFTSAPKRDKPIVVADCTAEEKRLVLKRFLEFADWPAFEHWLGEDGEWIGGFDFPFGLPRRFVQAQGWPLDWPGMVQACVQGGKERFVEDAMQAFQAAKQVEDKHRATDLVARSESPLKTKANPPVGRMFYEGSWRLLTSRLRVPGLHQTNSGKIAVEAYPGLVISRFGERYYKNDKARSAEGNDAARRRILAKLEEGCIESMSCAVTVPGLLAERMHHESGDWLDAVLCAVQAHWAWRQGPSFGLPEKVDPVEGWITSAGQPATS